jgi:hypothetical protein
MLILGPAFHYKGRPRAPRMQCGWGCGCWLTGHEMRAHFTRCPKRPEASDGVARRSGGIAMLNRFLGRSKPKRGRPPFSYQGRISDGRGGWPVSEVERREADLNEA